MNTEKDQMPQCDKTAVNHSVLTLKHLAPYLPYSLKYYPSEKSDLFYDLYADHAPYSSWNYKLALEAKDDFALKISKSYLTQKEPFFAYENGEIFLGQFNSSLGFDVDDVFESEVIPILRPLSDLAKIWKEMDEDEKDIFIHCSKIIKQEIAWQEPYFIVEILFKYHFDVFGLIKKGLAISIHDIE